jgi:hypothetical protein
MFGALALVMTNCSGCLVPIDTESMARCEKELSAQIDRPVALRMTSTLGESHLTAIVQIRVRSTYNVQKLRDRAVEILRANYPKPVDVVVEPVQ